MERQACAHYAVERVAVGTRIAPGRRTDPGVRCQRTGISSLGDWRRTGDMVAGVTS